MTAGSPEEATDRRTGGAVWGACVAAIVICSCWTIYQHLVVPVLPYDDAFITYRYVDNFTHGLGLTYNAPVRAWGYTSPLYLFWLSLWRHWLPAVDVPHIAVRGNALFMVAAGLGSLLLLRSYTRSLAIASLGCCLVMIHPALLSVSSGGMESPLFLALALFTLWALSLDRPFIAGLLLGFAYLSRPEAIALTPVFAVLYWRSWRAAVRAVLGALTIVGPWLLFAALYYHSIIPLSIIAKNRPLYPLEPGYALRIIKGFTGPVVFGDIQFARIERVGEIAGLLLALAGLVAVLYPPLRKRQAWAPSLFAACLVGLYDIGNPMFFEWYWPILLGAFLMMLLVAGAALVLSPSTSDRSLPGLRGIWGGAGWLVLGYVTFTVITSYADNSGGHVKSVSYVAQDPTRLRTIAYQTIGRNLNALAGPSGTVAAPEIGALGYAFCGRLIDACGLVSPEAIPFLPVPDAERMGPAAGAISVELVQATKPDWVVTMPIFAERSLLVSPWFKETYALVDTVPLPKPCFTSVNVLVYRIRAREARAPMEPKS